MLHGDALQSAPVGLGSGVPRPRDPEAIDFEAILRFARKRFRLWLAWLALGVLLGIGYALLSPPAYTATAAVLLQDPTPRMAGDVPVAQTEGAHSTYIETQIQVFASNEIIGRVVSGLDLVEDPEFGRNAPNVVTWLTAQARAWLRPNAPEHDVRQETVVRVRRALALRRVGQSDVLEIQFTSRNPARAVEFTGVLIHGYVEGRLAEQEMARRSTAEHDWKLLAELRGKAFPPVPPSDAVASSALPGPESRALFLEEQQRTETYRTLYARLLQRALGAADAQLVSPGLQVISAAAQPSVSSSRLIGIVALIGACASLGFAHALVREARDDVLRTVDDLRGFAEIGRVVVIPRLSQAELRLDRCPTGSGQPAYRAGSTPVFDAMSNVAVAMLEASGRHGRRLVGVVAPQDAAGTSLIAAQLARVLADAGSSTCLLDANWRLPPFDAALPSEARYGALSGWMERDALRPGLDLLTLRATAPVSGLNASLSILAALKRAELEHAWIIVDFHALGVTVDLEAAIGLLDQVVVVVQAQRATRQGLRQLLDLIPATKLAAVVLNKARVRRRRAQAAAPVGSGSRPLATGGHIKVDPVG